MTTPTARAAEQELVAAFHAQLQAMIDSDTTTLDALLDQSFTLTHITGYVQPKDEWLTQMLSGQFVYHGVEDKGVTVQVEGDTARLTGRFVTDATVYGTRADWRLQLTMEYRRSSGGWTAIRSVATTW